MGNRTRVGVLAIGLLAAPALADTELELSLGAGSDGNPHQLAAGSPDGAFTDLRLDAGFRLRPHRRVQLFSELRASERRFEGEFSNADTTRARLSLGASLVPWRDGQRNLTIVVGGRLRAARSTFIDPRTGGVYVYVEGDGNGGQVAAAVPDRFDHDSLESFGQLHWRFHRRARVSLNVSRESRSYADGPAQLLTLPSLDYEATTFEPGVRLTLNPLVTLRLSAYRTDRAYDAQTAVDAGGSDVPGVRRRYRYDGYRFALQIRPLRRLDLRFGFRSYERSDPYAGYYDSSSDVAYLWAEAALGRRNRLEMYFSEQQVDYENAPVSDDPDSPFRGGDVSTALLKYERELVPRLGLYAEAGTRTSDNRDPVFAYDRTWLTTGLTLRLARGGRSGR